MDAKGREWEGAVGLKGRADSITIFLPPGARPPSQFVTRGTRIGLGVFAAAT